MASAEYQCQTCPVRVHCAKRNVGREVRVCMFSGDVPAIQGKNGGGL